MQDLTKLKIPEGWTLEHLEGSGNQALLTTASTPRYYATIDFTNRGFRPGCASTGRFHGDDFMTKSIRKMHMGRGWAQALVDEAIAHLREVL